MTKHYSKHRLSQERFKLRQKIEVLNDQLVALARRPVLSSVQEKEFAQNKAFLTAEKAKLQRELDGMARGSKAQRLAGWGHV